MPSTYFLLDLNPPVFLTNNLQHHLTQHNTSSNKRSYVSRSGHDMNESMPRPPTKNSLPMWGVWGGKPRRQHSLPRDERVANLGVKRNMRNVGLFAAYIINVMREA